MIDVKSRGRKSKPGPPIVAVPARLTSEAALDASLADLCRHDALMRRLVAAVGRPPLRRREEGFDGLAWIIVSQQLSTSSARAIFGRLQASVTALDAAALLAQADDALRRHGLSAPKISTLRALATAIDGGHLALADLAVLEAAEAHTALCTIKGIGPWTADVYLLFCLGHPDAWPAGDLALQEAVRTALSLPTRPDAKTMNTLGERWRPWRGVAARVLWAYYAERKRPDLPFDPMPPA